MTEAACSKCGQPPKFRCERCLDPYCSSECQVADWPQHKPHCYKFPNLIPMEILKSTSNLSMKSDASSRRHYGSKDNINAANDTRRSNSSTFGNKSRNPLECGESCSGAMPKKILQDQDFALVPKTAVDGGRIMEEVIPAIPNRSQGSMVSMEKPPNWRVHFPPPSGFFDAMVQLTEEEVQANKRFAWVSDIKYDAPLRKLLSEINRNVNQKEPCNPELVIPGALVAAPLGNILYRAEILDCSPKAQKADVRLIDYGNELRVPYNQIFAPIPIMANLNAYAFRVCIQGDCGPLQLESVLTIRIVGEKHPEGYYVVECKAKSIPLQLPVESLTKEKSLSVVKCFIDGRNALLRLNSIGDLSALDEVLNSEQTIQYEFDKVPSEGAFVAARTSKGWKRARLLGCLEKSHEFLVYTIDEGCMTLTQQIKRIPTAFLTQPMHVFAVSTSSPDYMLSETMLATAKKLSLQLLPATSVTAGKDSKTHLSCALFEDSRKIVDVVIASVFTGCLDELGLQYWHDGPENGSFVTISHVLTFKEIYISAIDSNEYARIFLVEHSKCTPLQGSDDIKKGDLVFVCDQQGSKYRGQIINFEANTYQIMNVDQGEEYQVDRKCLYKPTNLLRALPIRCSLVRLMYLETIPTPVANNKALAALESCLENATEFEMSSEGANKAIDLLFRTNERQSLCKKLLPMVFEPRELPANKISPISSAATEKTNLPMTPPNTPLTVDAPAAAPQSEMVVKKTTYTLDDLEIIPIECGDDGELFILDPTTVLNLESPYVTAADFKNKAFLRKMENYLEMVSEYCKSPEAPKIGYAPKKMEICLSVFAEDKQWYRAMCVDQHNDTFLVLFLDYGNLSKVTKKDIMPIIPELMFPSNANMVHIEGITTKEQALKFVKATQANPIVKAKIVQLPMGDEYLAKVHHLDKVIAG